MSRVLSWVVLLFANVAVAQALPDPKPQQGGVAKEAGGLVYELKVAPGEIIVWVRDIAGKPVPTAGSAAKVTLIPEATLRAEVPLKPAGDNRFRTAGEFSIKPGASAELDVAIGDRPPVKLTYMLK
jgi:nitrogen fixation protein FixH